MKFRAILVSIVALVLMGSASPVNADDASQENFSCIMHTLVECRAILKAKFSISSSNMDEVAASWGKVDVSGKPITGKTWVYVNLQSKGAKANAPRYFISFYLRASGLIDNIKFPAKSDPMKAGTEEEFDRTEIYKILGPFLPTSGCPFADKLSFYRFLNDRLKPTMEGPERHTDSGVGWAADEYQYRTKRLPICGVYIDYRRDSGISTTFMDSDNPSGRHDDIAIIVWADPAPYQSDD